jgi:hypothetical protein
MNAHRVFSLLLLCSSPASAQLIIGGAPGSGGLWNVNPSNPAAAIQIPGSAGASPWGMSYAPSTNTLFWIVSGGATYSVFSSPFSPAGLSPIQIGGGVLPEGGSFLGLAFDSANNRLYSALWAGQHTSIYELNQSTGASSLAAVLPDGLHFSGFDYDAAGDRFLATTGFNATGALGLYQLNFRTGTPSYTQVANYPASEFEIEGLAVGNGRAYLVNSDGPIFVLNLSTGLYEQFLSSPLAGSGFSLAGAAWVPAPASCALLLAGAFGARRRR